MKNVIPIRAALAVLPILLALPGCRQAPPEQALRAQVAALHDAIEARDANALEGLLAEDFVGPDGLDRRGARAMARLLFLQNRQVGVAMGPRSLALTGDHATVRCPVVVTGGQGGPLPERGRVFQVASGWRRKRGEWLLSSIDWDAD